MLKKRAASEIEIGLLSNYPNAAAIFEARGASPLMRERRSNSLMMPYIASTLQAVEWCGLRRCSSMSDRDPLKARLSFRILP
jgi:hypothetical protein